MHRKTRILNCLPYGQADVSCDDKNSSAFSSIQKQLGLPIWATPSTIWLFWNAIFYTVMDESLCDALRRLRLATGQGIKRVAPQVGVSYSYLSKVENGLKKPSVDLLTRLSDLYGVDSDELLAKLGELPSDVKAILKSEGKAVLDLVRKEYSDPSKRDGGD